MRRDITGGLEMLHARSRISRWRSPRCIVCRGRRFNPGYALTAEKSLHAGSWRLRFGRRYARLRGRAAVIVCTPRRPEGARFCAPHNSLVTGKLTRNPKYFSVRCTMGGKRPINVTTPLPDRSGTVCAAAPLEQLVVKVHYRTIPIKIKAHQHGAQSASATAGFRRIDSGVPSHRMLR